MTKTKLASWSLALVACAATEGHAWVDDYDITLSSTGQIASRRAELIAFIWGTVGFPTTASELLNGNVPSPVAGLENLERVEKLRTSMSRAMDTAVIVTSYHFIPVRKRDRLVVVYQGHGCPTDFNDVPMQHTIKALLRDGYSALAIFMPLTSDEQCVANGHPGLFAAAPSGTSGIAYFLEPTAKSLNYVAQHHSYEDFSMVGLSGGGWTTTVYAAVDPRIKLSIPVAGSIPLYLRNSSYSHDEEQFHAAFYELAGYPDLYILGSHGAGRQQIQVLNRNDECCFSALSHDITLPHVADKPASQQDFESSVRLYEMRVEAVVKASGSGSFRVDMEESAHTISDHTIQSIIRPALNGGQLVPILQASHE